MSVRFLHTADVQLGMRRHFLSEEALPRFMQARVDALRTMGDLARAEGCAFAVVGGDLFESNQIDKRTLARAREALSAFPCPLFVLPGNHDPYDAGSLYRRLELGAGVTILTDDSLHEVAPGVQVTGAPWFSKRPRRDLIAEHLTRLEPLAGGARVLVGHGAVSGYGEESPERIDLAKAQRALEEERIHYLALGDRHSTTEVAPRIWYSGAPEATDYDESDSGNALVVELDADSCKVTPHRVGRWRFHREEFSLDGAADLDRLAAALVALDAKETTVAKLSLKGSLSLAEKARLDRLLEESRETFAGLELWARHTDLAVRPDDLFVADLGLAGFARATAEELALKGADPAAQDALSLLWRLAGGPGA